MNSDFYCFSLHLIPLTFFFNHSYFSLIRFNPFIYLYLLIFSFTCSTSSVSSFVLFRRYPLSFFFSRYSHCLLFSVFLLFVKYIFSLLYSFCSIPLLLITSPLFPHFSLLSFTLSFYHLCDYIYFLFPSSVYFVHSTSFLRILFLPSFFNFLIVDFISHLYDLCPWV